MTGLIMFIRELAKELLCRADEVESEACDRARANDKENLIALIGASIALRQIGQAIEVAAKRTLLA